MLHAIWCVVLLLSTAGQTTDVHQIVGRLEERYNRATTLRATFLERYTETGRTTREEAGTVFFRRPGKMRWEYESPEQKLFVSDGRTVWFYVPGDRTVVRAPVKETSDWRLPFALLTRKAALSRICSRIDLESRAGATESNHVILRCVPKERGESLREILIGVDAQTGELERVVIRERAGIEIDFRFADWMWDLPLAESAFRFTAPAGVAIVNGPAAQAESDN
jgi:outer membrane lipoprotein carrier protein